MTLADLLAGGAPLVLDGGLATELEEQGHDLTDGLWSARLLRDEPLAIEQAHAAYLRAGAQITTSASYQASVESFAAAGVAAEIAEELLGRSVELAQIARRRVAHELPQAAMSLVAASVGPYGAVLREGQEYTGDYGLLEADELEAFHERRLRVLLAAGPDCVACETIPRADEAAILADLLDRLDAPPSWISFACRDGGTTCHGEPIEEAVQAATRGRRVAAVGVNCTAPEHVPELLRRAATVTDLPLVAYPNSGRVWDGNERGWLNLGADRLALDAVAEWVAAGARIVGGCCGIGPAAIAGIAGEYA
ncbi:MAG TPA: homocysteine S-methyltransferase [Gaiellales bacterium]|jgi:homocysteine S-methyltransferase